MKRRYQAGFTIVEVVLFLAIAGALAGTLLATTTAAIQQQQYRDAVQSFAGFLRGQYERVVSVENDRAPSDHCPISGALDRAGRGQSDCVIVGRYITTDGHDGADADGTTYVTYPVYARQSGDDWTYHLGARDDNYQVNWSAKTKLPEQDSLRVYTSVLIYRDPRSGTMTIRSHDGRYTPSTIGFFIAGKDAGGATFSDEVAQVMRREICIYDEKWMSGRRQSVFIARYPGSADAITVASAEAEGCRNA